MSRKELFEKYFIWEIILFVLFLVLDLVTKSLVAHFAPLEETLTAIPYLFNIYFTRNTGAAFGILKGKSLFFIILTLVAEAAFVFCLIRFKKFGKLFRISMVMIIAGALGNLVDRMALGYVRDFIQFAFWDSFAIFNFADSELTIGVVMLAIFLIFIYKDPVKPAKREGAEEAAPIAEDSTGDDASEDKPEQ